MATEYKHALWFCGTDEDTPSWLINNEGAVLVMTEEVAKQMQELLTSDREKVVIRQYKGSGPTEEIEEVG